ncbi:MAG TPA: GTPase ObgE [Kiritimatiellia bacterium]|nr:GTPase ObgE [Kiritimatiellia bacterium]HMP00254.1 GTPase ObgE [Kiritimatiellia bacterium]HMP97845.1 GTPase ObgE [Kiritimatiellia bacterium]
MKANTFKDRVKIQVTAGDGGTGCVSFRREKFVPYGGPDGGNGGNGGNVLLQASKDVDSLISLYFQPIQKAGHGARGRGANCTGETGNDLILPVPCGTVVYQIPERTPHDPEAWDETPKPAGPVDPRDEERTWLGEVVHDGDRLQVAAGGRGGRGNASYATSTNRAPREFTPGTPGESRRLLLELKLVAEVGLVGYPNAGKSTLLSKLSHAHPKIAAYPFTTLNPQIGILSFDDFTTVRIADIPGLIEGAHHGVGLGYDFLRHIERTKLLIYVIDMAGVDGRDPVHDYESLRRELSLYNDDLPHRPALVVANKMDLPDSRDNLDRFTRETGATPLPLSAESGEGIEPLKAALYDWKRGRRFIDEVPATPNNNP